MKKRKLLGSLTVIAAIPALGFMMFFLVVYNASLMHWLVIEKIIIGFTCILGGVLLWQGHKWGYRLSIIGWMVILYVSFSSIYVAFQPETNEHLRLAMFSKDAIYLTVGLPALVILIRDMIKTKKSV